MIFCRGCGKEIHESAVSCPNCGAVQTVKKSHQGEKSKFVAFLLAFLLGPLGIHSFYLGKKLVGSIYLCLTIIPSIIFAISQMVFWHQLVVDMVYTEDFDFFMYYPFNMPAYWWVFWGLLAVLRLTSFIESIIFISMSDSKFKEKYG